MGSNAAHHPLKCLLAGAAIAAMGVTSASAASFLPAGADRSGFSPQGLDRVTAMLDAEVANGNIAGAIMLIEHHGKPVYYQGFRGS